MLIGLPDFNYLSCETLEEACKLLSEHAVDSKILAGGTDLFVKMKHRRLIPQYLIDIKKIKDLDHILYDEQGILRIGALTPIEEIRNSRLIMKQVPILSDAAGKLGTTHIRNLGTLGGNLANASPAAEFATSLMILDAKVKLSGPEGERTMSIEDFFMGPGKSALKLIEILTEIRIPHPPEEAKGIYLKYSTRPKDVAVVNMAIMATLQDHICEEIKIALGAVGPVPFRAKKAEDVIRGRKISGDSQALFSAAAEKAVEEAKPISDFRASATRRTRMIAEIMTEGLRRLFSPMVY